MKVSEFVLEDSRKIFLLQHNIFIIMTAAGTLFIFLVTLLLQCCRSELNCTIWRAQTFRDSICGVEHRDWERECHDGNTYFETTLHQDELYDAFECNNGGTLEYNAEFRYNTCNCRPGYYGFCCETCKLQYNNSNIIRN